MKENIHLIYVLAKRDIKITFTQTALGVFWFLLVPILTTLIFNYLFRNLAGIPTSNVPGILFYFTGVMCWNFFSSSVNAISNVFNDYGDIMGKVYFSRIIPPISILLSNLTKFGIQFVLFLVLVIYFSLRGEITVSTWAFMTPLFILFLCLTALAVGLFFCSLSFKYKDFNPIINLFLMILMYMTPIIYPLSFLPEHIKKYTSINPLANIIEGIRFIWFDGVTSINIQSLFITIFVVIIMLLASIWLYNKVEKDFIDTI